MALAPNIPFNSRELMDGNFVVTASIPSAATVFDLVQAVPYPTTEVINAYVTLTQTTATGTGSVTIQESADNSSWSNVAELAAPLLYTAGATSDTATFKLEPGCKRYVRASGSAGSGSVTATVGFYLKF